MNLDDIVSRIRKSAEEVFSENGSSFDDLLSDQCFRQELFLNGMRHVKILPLPNLYKGKPLDGYIAPVHQYIVEDAVFVEIDSFTREEEKSSLYFQQCLKQVLKAKAVAINFGVTDKRLLCRDFTLGGDKNIN